MTYDYSRDEEAWAENEPPPPPDHNPPPAGTYVCEVISAKIDEGHSSGYAEVKIGAQITDGDHAGKMCWPKGNLDPAPIPSTGKPPIFYLRKMVQTLGYRGTASGLAAAVPGFVGARVQVAAVINGQYTNYYINKRLDDVDEEVPF